MSAAIPNRMRSLVIVLSLLVSGACGGHEQPTNASAPAPAAKLPPPPTVTEAKSLIANSPEFSDFEFTNAAFTLATSRNAMSAEQRAAAKDLAAAGWLRIQADGIELTGKAKNDRRWLARPNGTVDLVPLASKELVEVTAVHIGEDGNPAVTFGWRWLPNEIGSSFRSGPVHDRFAKPQRATATLLRDGQNWSVLRIRPEGR